MIWWLPENCPICPRKPKVRGNTGQKPHPVGTIEHMFAIEPDPRLSRERDPAALAALAALAERTRPIAASRTRLLPVAPALAGLLPDGALRRGSTLAVGGPGDDGALSVALALVAAASASGSWCALVGHPGLGAVAAHDLGVDLGRLALLPPPGPPGPRPPPPCSRGSTWSCCARRSRPARPWPAAWCPGPRTAGRAGGGPGRVGWPEAPDLQLRIDDVAWEGVGGGEGHLRPSPDDGDRHRAPLGGAAHPAPAVAARPPRGGALADAPGPARPADRAPTGG